MGSAEAVTPPTRPLRRYYHFTTHDYAISDIENSHLKVATFADANDPFEVLSLNFREKRTRKIVRSFKSAYGSETGLICFSANWTNPLIWSHYAEKHRGICLGFDIPRPLLTRVKYQDKRILHVLGDGDDANPDKLPAQLKEDLVRTKSHHWSYEKEYRRFLQLSEMKKIGNLCFCPFANDMRLREVILGPQNEMDLDAIRHLLKSIGSEAVAFKSRLAFKSFSVVPDERTIP